MSTPFLGEIKIASFNFAPKGWALCNGQFLPINQNQALFALLGTMYGGNGQTTFALPNLQGRTPIHLGSGFTQGEAAGQTAQTLITSQLPGHTHLMSAGSPPADQKTPADSAIPAGYLWCDWGKAIYAAAPDSVMSPSTIAPVGGSQPHNNLSPYLVLNFIIALQGIFPSQT